MINNVGAEPPQKYKDPLNKNIVVMMSYSNEVGTAIAEIAPKLGAALWAPTFMYLGADIYDKYKNDKDNFDPSAKRALKRVIFQGLTSLIALPALIYMSQSMLSPLGKYGKSQIPGNTREAIYKHTKDVISQAHSVSLTDYDAFKTTILTTLENKMHTRETEKRKINPIKRLYHKFFTDRYALLNGDKKKVLAFAEQNAKETYEIMENLRSGNKDKIPHKIYKKYKNTLPTVKEIFKNGDYSHLAVRSALKEYQTSLIFKNKLAKTLVGLITLVIFAKPVNDLVEKYIMKKYVKPKIDQLDIQKLNNTKIKKVLDNFNSKTA